MILTREHDLDRQREEEAKRVGVNAISLVLCGAHEVHG